MQPVETEAAFMICAPDIESAAGGIADLHELAGMQLRPGGVKRMRDIHFDTPERHLAARGFVLRIRRLASGDLLTLKGASRQAEGGGTERLEIEGPWSRASIAKITRALEQAGVELSVGPVNTEDTDHVRVLINAGLELIQERETERTLRDCVNDSGRAVAELSIDRVAVHLPGRIGRFMQVELESKATGESAAYSRLVDALRLGFGDVLRVWPYGKLATGLAIADELANGRLNGICDENDSVTPRGCDVLEDILRRQQIQAGSVAPPG